MANSSVKKIYISKDAVAKIALTAAESVGGVSSVVSLNGKAPMFSKKQKKEQFIKAAMQSGEIIINLALAIEPNANAADVAKKVQTKVKEEVQNMTSSVVSKVNITIDDVIGS